MSYGGNYAAHRFSALDQINRDNVKQLTPVWMFHTGELRGGLNSTPIVVDGVMYLMGPMNRVFAINAATGEKLWSYIYKLPQMSTPTSRGRAGWPWLTDESISERSTTTWSRSTPKRAAKSGTSKLKTCASVGATSRRRRSSSKTK